jgi:hypothetical protein
MSVVLGGLGSGCVVTRGYGCPRQPQVAPECILPVSSKVTTDIQLFSPVYLILDVMTFVRSEVELSTRICATIEISSTITGTVDIRSPISVNVDIFSEIADEVEIDSPIC